MSAEIVGDSGAVVGTHVAAVAAEVARAVPGVERLQPDLWGLVQQISKRLWQRVTEESYPDIAGVEAEVKNGVAVIEIAIIANGHRTVAAVVHDVQRDVAEAVVSRLDVPVACVAVHVCDISLV